jgi:hypothetical protein
MLLIWDNASYHRRDGKMHQPLMRGGKTTVNHINSGCIGMIKPQRAQRTQRKRRERYSLSQKDEVPDGHRA